jgi:6-phosphofructokinase 1
LFDRILGTRVGIKAANLVHDRDFGKMVALQGTHVLGVPIKDAVDNLKVVPRVLYDTLSTTFQT